MFRVHRRQEDVSAVDRQGADVRSPELFLCITVGDDRICVSLKWWDNI